jgi:iron complex outermembrane receptor protein
MGTLKSKLVVGAATLLVPTGPALAQTAGDASTSGDIIVTARRTEERLQDVPISISVYTQQQIADRNIATATDLASYTPSLSVNQRYGPEKASYAIRGFNQDQYTAPTVGIYFADVVGVRAQGGTASGNTVGPGSFMDLQNVQVLKGPQGTLFGRNTTGGAILLVPNRPSDRLEGNVEGTIGNYGARRVQGVLNLPLAETFKVRLAMDRSTRDGYMKNRSGIGPGDYNDVDYFAARLSILAELTPDLENLTIAHLSDSKPNGFASRIVACDPAAAGFAALTASSACEQIARQAARGDGLLDVEVNNAEAFITQQQWQITNTTSWLASDTLTLKNIMSYGQFRERSSFSLYSDNFRFTPVAQFFSSANIVGRPYQYINLNTQDGYNTAYGSTFTEELQLQGSAAQGRLTYVVGGYLEFSRPLGWHQAQIPVLLNCAGVAASLNCVNPTFVDVPGFGTVPIGNVIQSRTKPSFDNHGIFAQASFKLTDELSLTAGARYTFDKIRVLAEGTELNPFIPGVNNRTCQDTLRRPNTPAIDPTVCRNVIKNDSKKPTWLINADYKPSNDLMLYAKYARGYRQGGVSPIGVGLETWGPEKVDAYEVGVKASFHGAVRGYFNVAGFYNDFRDQQLTAGLLPRDGGSGSASIVNVGKSRIQGIEADASVTLFDSLKLDLGYTYLDTKVIDLIVPTLPPSAPYVGVTVSVREGDPLPYSPKNRISLTGTYTIPVSEKVGRISIGATYVHTDRQGFGNTLVTAPNILRFQPATDLLNLNFNWDSIAGSPVDLALFATNVANELYGVATGGGYQAAGFGELIVGQPRMYGLRVRYRFGE